MNYQIVSRTGYKTNASTLEDAVKKARQHSEAWMVSGAPNFVPCQVFYFGQLVYTTVPPVSEKEVVFSDNTKED